jgi:outer membrane protein assembly factor BamD
MDRSDDAKARLLALHQPVPRPTKAALAQNKAEDAARQQQTTMSTLMGVLQKHPDVSAATKVGEPTLEDKEPISANGIVQQAQKVAVDTKSSGSKTATVVTTGTGAPPESEAAPRSDAQPPETASRNDAGSQPAPPDPNELKPGSTGSGDPGGSDPKDASDPKTAANAPDPNELKPDVAPTDRPAPAPAQVNEIQQGASGTPQATANAASSQDLADDKDIASSKHKKKKGLSKIIPLPKTQ